VNSDERRKLGAALRRFANTKEGQRFLDWLEGGYLRRRLTADNPYETTRRAAQADLARDILNLMEDAK